MISVSIVLVAIKSSVGIWFWGVGFQVLWTDVNVQGLLDDQGFEELLVFQIEVADHGSSSDAYLFCRVAYVLRLDRPWCVWIWRLNWDSAFLENEFHCVLWTSTNTPTCWHACSYELFRQVDIGAGSFVENQVLFEECDCRECMVCIAIGLIFHWSHCRGTSPIKGWWGSYGNALGRIVC